MWARSQRLIENNPGTQLDFMKLVWATVFNFKFIRVEGPSLFSFFLFLFLFKLA
jgi:hypothetical protein